MIIAPSWKQCVFTLVVVSVHVGRGLWFNMDIYYCLEAHRHIHVILEPCFTSIQMRAGEIYNGSYLQDVFCQHVCHMFVKNNFVNSVLVC